MDNRLFRGVGTALPTPLRGGEIDLEAFQRLAERQITAGAGALVVCGTTGEPATLTAAEREGLIACAVRCAGGRVPVVAGIGCNDTREAVRRARRAEDLGADALLAVTPYYNKTTQEGLVAHYAAVADAASVPLILYNVPSRTGLNLLPETTARLARHPRILALKEAGGVAQAAETLRLCGEGFALYAGSDEFTLPILALGGQGVISVAANVCPGLMAALCARFFAGDLPGARALQRRLAPLVEALFCEVSPIPLKAALAMLGLCRDEMRLPLVPASPACRTRLRSAMELLDLPLAGE